MSKRDKKDDFKSKMFESMNIGTKEMEAAANRVGSKDERTGKVIQLLDINYLNEAPKDWDQFPEPTKEQYLRMKFSIIENGLIYPIVVWDRGDEKMIIAGKTRTRIYRDIRDNNEGNPDLDYNYIPAIVFERHELNKDQAINIIIESNTEQRKDNTKELPFIVKHKVNQISKRKNKKGDSMDKVAKDMNMSRTKIYEEKVLATEIDEDIVRMFYDGILNRKTVLRFKRIDRSAQNKVYEKLLKNLTREDVKKKNIDERSKGLKKDMSFEEIKEVLTSDPVDMKVQISAKIPAKFEDEFQKMLKEWLESKE